MPEYNFTFDWNRITTIGKVKILAEQVVGNPSQEALNAAVAAYIEDHPGALSPLSAATKAALLQIAEKVAYVDEHGQDYYDALYDAFYPPAELVGITAVYTQSGVIYDTDTLDNLKPDLVVTALYSDSTTEVITSGYMLSGTLTAGTSTITVSYGGQMTTFTVTVTHYVRPSLYNWDFTQSLTDTVQGQVAVLAGGVTQSSAGLTFTGSDACCLFGADVFPINRTLEVDFASMSYNLSNHGRLIMFADTSSPSATGNVGNGFILKSATTPYWAFYKGGWSGNYGTDRELFSGKTLVMKYYLSSDDNKYHTDVYCNSDLVASYSSTGKWNSSVNPVQIGSNGNTYKNMVVTGARIYEGVD